MKTLLTTLFIIISISAFGQDKKRTPILFNGFYETKCLIEEDDDEGSQNYLRFYPDRKVISIGTDCEGSVEELKDWYNSNSEMVSIGKYEIKGRKMSFSSTGKTGTVHYKGKIMAGNVLKLKWKSSINGEKGREEYKFIKLTGLK